MQYFKVQYFKRKQQPFQLLFIWLYCYQFQMIISLDNFDEHGRTKPFLNSPRSLQACQRQGIEPEQLIIKTIEQIKQIYKDGMNDKKSLQIKLQHYQARRKNKLDIVRKQRQDIIANIRPIYRPNHATKQQRVEIVEIQDKLQKKKIMDEIHLQLKQKQLQMKEMNIEKKLNRVNQNKKEQQIMREMQNKEGKRRTEIKQIQNQILEKVKVNNYFASQQQKRQKIEEKIQNKRQIISQIKKQKQQYYDKKFKYCKQLEEKAMIEKRIKVEKKFNELDQRIQEREERDEAYRQNLEQEKRKDILWRQTKQKQVEIEQKKKQGELVQAILYKQIKKEEYIQEIQGKKSRYYNTKKQDREQKSQLVKAKLLQDQKEIEKRRRIMELVQEDQRKQEEQRRFNQRAEMEARRQELIKREKERQERLKEEEKMKDLNNQYLIQKKKQKLSEIDEKKKELLQKQKEKTLQKQIKLRQAQQNRKRMQKIKQYEKMQDLKKYNDKVNQIDQQRKSQKKIKVFKNIDRSQVESKIISQSSVDRKKSKQNRAQSNERINAIKVEAKKDPLEVKQKLKKEQINKLIQDYKIKCLMEEQAMMNEEKDVERRRQQLQKTAQNVAQLRRLQKIHGVERARFQDKLSSVMKGNEQKISNYRQLLLQ